jgi:hypothetical protein
VVNIQKRQQNRKTHKENPMDTKQNNWNMEYSLANISPDQMRELSIMIAEKVESFGGFIGGGYNAEVEDDNDSPDLLDLDETESLDDMEEGSGWMAQDDDDVVDVLVDDEDV